MGKQSAQVTFDDGTPMKRTNEAKYLGTMLNNKGDPAKELKARISNTIVTWKTLIAFGYTQTVPTGSNYKFITL